MVMNSSSFKKFLPIATVLGNLFVAQEAAYSKVYLTVKQAKEVSYKNVALKKIPVVLTKKQMKSIKKASDTTVRDSVMNVWKTADGDWFIVDNVIGKHENIDFAVALSKDGKVKNIEVLQYRETYGYEIMNRKWLAQFFGRGNSEILRLDKQIKNISGATLSCRHLTDGINRLTHTWDQVLKFL